MADLSDVSTALRDLIYITLYPTAPTEDDQDSSAGVPVSVMVGWPGPNDVDTAIADGTTLLNIYPVSGSERNTTRFESKWIEVSIPDATYTLTEDGQTITVGGAAPETYFAQNIYLKINGTGYCYTALDGDTPSEVASGLLDAISDDWPSASVSDVVLTLPSTARMDAMRVGVSGTVLKEVGRQERDWQIIIWAPTDDARNAVAKVIDPVLREMPRLELGDGSYAHLSYKGSPVTDELQKVMIFRRDLIYTCEYGTTVTDTVEQIVDFPVALGRIVGADTYGTALTLTI